MREAPICWFAALMSASLTHARARRILDAGIAKAEEIGQPMNIAVVDAGGHLVAFGRMDGAIKASIDISTRKAVTSILMNLPTAALTDLVQPGAELYGLEQLSGGMVAFGGGIPLHEGGELVGAVGVSAGSVEQDVAVAEAAAKAFG
jgi:uncharacterized protein GlcG (DUF336 family)